MKTQNETYKLLRFEKASPPKKYTAVLLNKKTGREKRVNFGASAYEQYQDTTGVGAWSHKNHFDKARRANYRARHAGEGDPSNFPNAGFFAMNYLWR